MTWRRRFYNPERREEFLMRFGRQREMAEMRNPSPNFYKVIALAFLGIGAWLIWQAVVRHEWFYWAIGIMTIVNGLMSGVKSLTPRETRR